MHLRRLLTFAAALAAGAALPGEARAQAPDDIELLGRIHGTRPPQAYYRMKAERPDAFRFERGWMARNPRLRRANPGERQGRPDWLMTPSRRADGSGPAGTSGAAGSSATGGGSASGPSGIGPRDEAVVGTFRFPLVLGLYADSPLQAPYSDKDVQREFFDGPSTRYGTITQFYDEISGGRVTLLGETHGWARSTLSADSVAGGVSGLGSPARVGEYIFQILSQLDDGSVDWGVYDNDGPDGVPNSGDDDGFVDILAVMHPTHGAECGGNGASDRMWSHKWSLVGAAGQPYVTGSQAAAGGNIRIADYTIQPVLSCDGTSINEIGVLAHELGHGFGLPDLYATSGGHAGIGQWGLMGSGSWGCSIYQPSRPCHMSAWSKAMLGWVEVQTLEADADLGTLALGPVEETGVVYRVDAGDGSNEFFLLENRQPLGFDGRLFRSGLLVWHIDESRVLQRWSSNSINSDRTRMGVWLRQADGLDQLALFGGGRGDAGDPFPGSRGNAFFHAGSTPSALTHAGGASGLTLMDITEAGGEVTFRAFTRFNQVTLQAAGGPGGDVFTVDGVAATGQTHTFPSAPFQRHVLRATPGVSIEEGLREGFEGWSDDPELGPERTFTTGWNDSTITATYGGRQVRVRVTVEGGTSGLSPGTIAISPEVPAEGDDFWVAEGTQVVLTAEPTTGFGFVEWTGDAAGQGNPAALDGAQPRTATAVFEQTYAVGEPSEVTFEAARAQEIVLQADNGTSPIQWAQIGGALPDGMAFGNDGVIEGAALVTGTFQITVRAFDARGLEATATVELVVTHPRIAVTALASTFLLQGPPLDQVERVFLDRAGNGNGFYDLGDLRAFLLAHPDLPMTAQERALVRTLLPLVRFAPGGDR